MDNTYGEIHRRNRISQKGYNALTYGLKRGKVVIILKLKYFITSNNNKVANLRTEPVHKPPQN